MNLIVCNPLIPQIIYASLCVIFAYINAEWIKADKPIDHKKNGLFHGICWVIACILFRWELIFVLPFIGKTVFDISLNLYRKLYIGYISLPSNHGSKLDEWEYEAFDGDGVKAKFAYTLIIVIVNMFYWYCK